MVLYLESWHYALDLKRKVYTSEIQKRRCRRKVQLLNNVDVENDLLDKRVFPSQPLLQQIRQVFTNGTLTLQL